MKRTKPGQIVIISSPSGGGKTSICRRLLSPARKRQGWRFSVSYTTREKRRGEKDGLAYYFVSEQKFDRLAQSGFFAEHCHVHLYRYGTPRRPLEQIIKQGGMMVLDVDVQGALKLRKVYPQAITIFVLPPSVAALRGRLKRRGTESKEQLKVRFQNARREMKLFRKFEYVVINDDLNIAVREVLSVINSHPCRTENLSKEQIATITG
jgi:guanylate kinase